MIDMGRPRAGALTSGRPPDFILVKFAVFDAHVGGPAGAGAAVSSSPCESLLQPFPVEDRETGARWHWAGPKRF